jgi:putative restriction endonuclease
MELVKTLKDIMYNANKIDEYLCGEANQEFAKELIKKDVYFLVVKIGSWLKFYPSCYLGYIDNSYDKHINNDEKDRKEISQIITKIVKYEPDSFNDLELEYCSYCEKLGIVPNKIGLFGVKRKYWRTNNFEFNGPHSYWNTNRLPI